MLNILIVDDNDKIRKLIAIYLKNEGFNPLHASDGKIALEILSKQTIDLIILDIMMPNMDGFELTKQLRNNNYDIPILMVTAKDSYLDKKEGFELGVDDYMTKPIDMDEMILRVKALLRRAKIFSDKKIVIGNIIINYDTLEITRPNETIVLPKKEFYLLYKLLSYPKKILTRHDIMDDIWGYDVESDERTVDVHIKRLREKLNHIDEFKIITIRGLGYKAEINYENS